MDAQPVILKNGARSERPLVEQTMAKLRSIQQESPTVFAALVDSARNSAHRMFAENGRRLQRTGLIRSFNDDGTATIDDGIRVIITAAVVGDGLTTRIISPYRS